MISEKIIVGEGTVYPLEGLLTLPETKGEKVPAVVFVHGSGAGNMDEQVYALTPFRDLAEGLAARGVASIRYDKRTFTYGRQLRGQLITVEEETIEDAIRAAEVLRSDPRIDADAVFIVGHSMGAMLAPRIDAEGGAFRGLVLLAGTPLRLEDIVVRQLRQAGKGKGGLMAAIVKLEDRIFSKKFYGLYEMSDEEAKKKKFAGGLTLYYFKEMGQKTAADYLLETDKPVLILQGGKDFQVLPEEDFAAFREQLKDRPAVEYRLYDELNHLFVKSVYNDILKAGKEYKLAQHIPGEVLDDIASFVLQYSAAAPSADGRPESRVRYYEGLFDELLSALSDPDAPQEKLRELSDKVGELERYLSGAEWKADFAADESGLLPRDLKRGVLSEDGLWNALEDWRERIGGDED